jgi:hypothetical protein
MRSLRFMLLSVVLMSLCTVALAQSQAQKSEAPKADPQKSSVAPVPSEAQKSFDKLKTLAGSWEGRLTTVPQAAEVEGKLAQVSLRVTSRGNALMHDLTVAGIPDNPITMFYLDSDRMLLTHYCDAGNRPRMTGKMSPDEKTVEFEFVDITGKNQHLHMHHALFTIIDADHHTEDWTFMMGDQPIHAHFDLHRKS